MNISPINNVNSSYSTYSPRKEKNKNKSMNIGLKNLSDSYGKYLVSFKSKKDIVKLVEEASLSDKLAVVMGKMRANDLLIVANDLKKSKETLKEMFDKFKIPVTRIIHLQTRSLPEILLFTSGLNGVKKILNVNSQPITLNAMSVILPNEAQEIECGDRIGLLAQRIEIKDKHNANIDLENHMSLFSRIYDYTESADKLTHMHNLKVLNDIVLTDKPKKGTVTFADVGGQEEVIASLKRNLLYPLKYPEVFDGFMNSVGAIFYGKPGTGKTFLGEAFVGEAEASIFMVAATELSAKHVGESEQNCRDLFQRAVEAQPSVIYMDEFDALGKARGGHDVHGDKLLNQFLTCMSDISKNGDKVIVIGSTNRLEDLDPAILRSGRFDLQYEIKPPDLLGTKEVFLRKVKGKALGKDIDADKISELMFSKKMTQADITATVRNAHVNALERCGIYKSMDEKRFSPAMLDYFSIDLIDFIKAIDGFKSDVKNRKPIGYGVVNKK